MSASGLVLAVDCGSSSLKAGLFNPALERLGEASVPVPYARQDGIHAEMAAEDVWQAFLDAAGAACRGAGVPLQSLAAVAFDSQAQTFALCDTRGRALTPFYSWMDRRASAEAGAAGAALGQAFHRHCSFGAALPQLQLCKMRWVRDHCPDLSARAAALVLLPGFLAWRLGLPNTVDRNLAAMGGAYSLAQGDWWPPALDFAGFAVGSMPRLVDIGARVPVVSPPCGGPFPPGLELVFAGNDQTAGAYGNGCERGGMVVTLGTALVVYRHAGTRPGPYRPGGCWGPYPGGSFYELATLDEGCRALDWARERLLPQRPAGEFDALAFQTLAAGAEGGAPRFHPERLASGSPWTGPVDAPAATAYAVLEGICFALRRLIEGNLHGTEPARRITAIGGGSRSDLWLQLMATVLQIPVCRGLGDALLGAAAMAVGVPPPAPGPSALVCEPDPVRGELLSRRYRQWLVDP